ncbi:MAG: CidA/LrgA family protein [Moritella sp.]|uniref:CidA/LrgA family protein n=1 Tax=Moritella sp. PE36 TaxID=58051 RepID=UPI0001569510|nr:CidA/LrgA family protein [Moritella sp. PE36]EDM66108.1 Putative effector of murein hydrolase LrgA [Moritella sp. PE36]PHR89388.1 MAG: CidA/LrgA family protein [Moritella sp.]
MKIWLYNIFTIFCFVVLGRGISMLLPVAFPSSIIGLLLLFVALSSGMLKQKYVEKVCEQLNRHIGILFVPAGVALMGYFELVQQNLVALIMAGLIGTVAIFFTVGHTYCYLNRASAAKDKAALTKQPGDDK